MAISRSGRYTAERLIEAGAEVWVWRGISELIQQIEAEGCRPELMPPSALHGKMMLVDDELSGGLGDSLFLIVGIVVILGVAAAAVFLFVL